MTKSKCIGLLAASLWSLAPPLASASKRVPLSLEGVICQADAIVRVKVLDIAKAQRLEEAPAEEGVEDCDSQQWRYGFQIQVLENIRGPVQSGNMAVEYLEQFSERCSFAVPASGIETSLKRNGSYLLLLFRDSHGKFSVLRAEPVDRKEQIVELLAKYHCEKRKV